MRRPAPQDRPAPEDQTWLREEGKSRGRAWAYATAIVAHAVLLLLNVPTQTEVEGADETPKDVIRLVQPPRPKPPEPEAPPPPPERRRIVPIPDPDPDDIEPLTIAEVLEPELEFDTDLPFVELPSEPPPVEEAPSGPMEVTGEVNAPVLLHKVQPKYSEIGIRVRRQGIVILEAVIDPQGNIADLKVIKSLGFGLDESALDAARQWKFTPATLRGQPVPVYWRLTVNFQLN